MCCGSEDSEKDLKGADVALLFTFLTFVFKNKPEGNTNGHARRVGLFGEVDDKMFCPALNSPRILGFGTLRVACEI